MGKNRSEEDAAENEDRIVLKVLKIRIRMYHRGTGRDSLVWIGIKAERWEIAYGCRKNPCMPDKRYGSCVTVICEDLYYHKMSEVS